MASTNIYLFCYSIGRMFKCSLEVRESTRSFVVTPIGTFVITLFFPTMQVISQ